MSVYSKVLWSEGLFLRPQHFQQQERFFGRLLETRCGALRSHSWGFAELELERDLLAIGKLGLRRAIGVFPDGTPFRMPEDEPLPAALDVAAEVRDQIAYLIVPVRQPASPDVNRGPATDVVVRHSIREIEARDTTAESVSSALMEVAPLRTRIALANEPTEGYARIPLAHVIERRADQMLRLDDAFMPTVLDARAAPPLATFITELQGLMHQRGDALGGRVASTGRGGAAEIADFLLLQAINRYEPLVAHCATGGAVHPEQLFQLFSSAAGELATFTTASKRASILGGYQHERLRESFAPVIAALRAAFSAEMQQMAIEIPIEPKKFGLSVATVADRSLFSSAVFILAARADMPAEELRKRFPAQLKIAPVEKITNFVNLQLPGLPVQPIPVAPRQIPYHAGFVYFELDQANELWSQLKTSGGVGMHLAGEFPGLKMEFWAIRS